MTYYGCDISAYQGDIDWRAFNPGSSFVIIKAGGGDDGLYTDAKFYQNRNGVRSLGPDMPHGWYWFAGGNQPELEADAFCNLLSDLQPGEVVALDYEINLGNADAWCAAFLNRCTARLGFVPLFYTNQNRVMTIDWPQTVATGCGLWVAHYGYTADQNVPIKWWPFYVIHQTGSNGSFPGISGRVDVDAFFANSITDFYKYGKPASAPPPQPAPAPAPGPVPTPTPDPVPSPQPVPAPIPDPVTPPVVSPPATISLYEWVSEVVKIAVAWLKGWTR